ncbi:MAG: hypothetical protein JSS91_01925 [Bacteroidetes bacterium]|nr:hypothetical protein [Bacteroidota bacterium]
MISSNITEILSSLSSEELKRFRVYVSSAYFNRNENVIKFFEHLIKFYPDFREKKLTKEYIFAKVFGNKEYNDGMMRTVSFKLNTLLKDFLVHSRNERETLRQHLILLEEYNRRKLYRLFLKKFEEINNILEQVKHKDEEYYSSRIKMQRQMELFTEINRFKKKDYNIFKQYSLRKMSENLSYYITLCIFNNNTLLFEENEEVVSSLSTNLIKVILEEIMDNNSKYNDNPVINLNRLQILLHKENNEEYYRELKKLFLSGREIFDHFERYNLLNVLQHFCIIMIFRGNSEYRRERFELYKEALRQKLFAMYEDEYFDYMLFGNIVLVSIAVSELDWLGNFIKEYSPYLSPEIRDTAKKYSEAKVCFAKGNFSEAMRHINGIENSVYARFDTTLRDLKMQCLYELGYFQELLYQFDAYSHFLRSKSNNLPKSRQERIKNYLMYFRKLIKIKENKDQKLYSETEYELLNNANILERTWLLKKLKEVKI